MSLIYYKQKRTMAQLAIKGHPEKGNEVIERLEMLGGINSHNWIGSFYSHYEPNGKKFYIIGGSYYLQCIPYEGNEHLLDTSNDCDEYYKTW